MFHGVILDLSISYFKLELSKAGNYRTFVSLCISSNFLQSRHLWEVSVIAGVIISVPSPMLTISYYYVPVYGG